MKQRPAHAGWYVVVKLDVREIPQAISRALILAGVDYRCPTPPVRAIGPVGWSRARSLSEAWEREFGAGTTRVTDAPRQSVPHVRADP